MADDEKDRAFVSVAAWRRINEAGLSNARSIMRLTYHGELAEVALIELLRELGSVDRAAALRVLQRARDRMQFVVSRRTGPNDDKAQESMLTLLNALRAAAEGEPPEPQS